MEYIHFQLEIEEHEHEEASHDQRGGGQERHHVGLCLLKSTDEAVATSAWWSAGVVVRNEPPARIERHIAIKGQLLPLEPFDRDLLDERPPMPDLEDLLRRIHEKHHQLTWKPPA